MDVPALLPDAGYRHLSVPHAVAFAQSDDEVDGLRAAAAWALSSDYPSDRIVVELDQKR